MRATLLVLVSVGCALPEGGLGNQPPPVEDASHDVIALPDAGSAQDATADSSVDLQTLCAAECPAAGGTCGAGGVCTFDCSKDDSCGSPIVCPPNIPCQVSCTGDQSCAGDIDCTSASQCAICCSGSSACGGVVACAGSLCRAYCDPEQETCSGGVTCKATTCVLDAGACP